jgi:protein-S-isoprenylcysteine O-methyltransferase Ste14
MDMQFKGKGSKLVSFVRGVRNLVGAGLHLLVLGLLLEGLTLVVQRWVTLPIPLALETQVLVTVLCATACLLGVIWFNCSLNLIRVHLLKGRNELVTRGPFAYVRHPLYSTLLMTLPPLTIVWLSDLLFIVPWVLILLIAHPLVRLEEQGLVQAFGREYEDYRRHVPTLLPYKGSGGNRYRAERP